MFGTLAGLLLVAMAIFMIAGEAGPRMYLGEAILGVAAVTCAILELAMAINRRR